MTAVLETEWEGMMPKTQTRLTEAEVYAQE
jgi:hypothetical protein